MRYISFSDKDVVLNVLKNYQQLKNSSNLDLIEMIVIIDDLIEKCKFNEYNIELINLIKKGYSINEISEKIGKHFTNIYLNLEKIVYNIIEINDFYYFRSCFYKKSL